ncbi:hypothetical protein [Clostridium sp.]
MRKELYMNEDGFEETSENISEVTEPIKTEQVEDTIETVNAGEGEVVAPIVDEKPIQDAETNANYAKMRREAQAEAKADTQKAIDKEYESMYGESHNIHSKADYDLAVIEANRQVELEELSKSVNPDVARELQEGREFRRKYETEQKTKAEQDKIQKGYDEFSREYPDVKGDDIPLEVWQAVNEGGKSLTDAYARYETKSLKERIKTLEHNKNNDDKSPVGSVTSYGSKETAEEDDFMKGFNSY